MSILPGFYEADRLEQVAITLFYGWGYNFYRIENQRRADDQLVRSRVQALLGAARENILSAESRWRRDHLPPPTREKPRPDPAAVAAAQTLERLAGAIGGLIGQIASQPVPEGDRMTQRRRDEAGTLAHLIAADTQMAGQAEVLRAMVEARGAEELIGAAAALETGVAAIRETLRERAALVA